MIYCFDLDDTLCFPNHQFMDAKRKYAQAEPNVPMIRSLNKLKENGHKIIIFTARRMLTHNGDLDKIKDEVQELTELWLKECCVNYDELIFGKPYADFYIDDKNVYLERILEEVNDYNNTNT